MCLGTFALTLSLSYDMFDIARSVESSLDDGTVVGGRGSSLIEEGVVDVEEEVPTCETS